MECMSERLLDYVEVGKRLCCGRTHLFLMVKRGEFPEPLRMGRARRWRESDVDAWIANFARQQQQSANTSER